MKNTLIYCIIIFAAFVINNIYDYINAKKVKKLDMSFLSRDYTTVLKGIAILMVIISHIGNANGTRIVAPLGAMGVSIFLICSGYGINESSRNGVNVWTYSKKRIVSVILPYALTRLVVTPFLDEITPMMFLLDITAIHPQYLLGWYLPYIMFWYVIYLVSLIFKNPKYRIAFMLCISVVVFFTAPSALQAENSLSFVTGVILSELKHSNFKFTKGVFWGISVGSFAMGAIAFIVKQLNLFTNEYAVYLIKLGYRYFWGLATIFVIYLLSKYISFSWIKYVGIISFELYLTHAYFWSFMIGFRNIPIFILGLAFTAIILHFVVKKIKRLAY